MQLRYILAHEIRKLLAPAQATEAIAGALVGGLDPALDFERGIVPLNSGQLLVMPAERPTHTGIKVATVAPKNPSLELPRIQGLYLLFDSSTLTPKAILDGTELTAVRTPAVSIAAIISVLRQRSTPLRIAVFGSGRQGIGHVETLADVARGWREMERVSYIVRSPVLFRTDKLERAGLSPSVVGEVLLLGSPAADEAVAAADIVICATSAREPIFDSSIIRSDAIVIAVGSHEPDVREIDAALCARAQVVVEDVATALRESGDVVMAIAEGATTAAALTPLRDVVTGAVQLSHDRPILFKSSGMSWEDLVIAEAVLRADNQRRSA